MKITFPKLVSLWKQPKSALWLSGILCIVCSLCVEEPWKTTWNILGLAICIISMFYAVKYLSKTSPEGQEVTLADLRSNKNDLKVVCLNCNKNLIFPTKTCKGTHMRVVDGDDFEEYQRMPYTGTGNEPCSDCGVKTGGLHHQGCMRELCMNCNTLQSICPCEVTVFTP